MLNSVDSKVFAADKATGVAGSKYINMVPYVSAEWNQNLFNPPYITLAGTGAKITNITLSSGTVSDAAGENIKPNFTTKSFAVSSGSGSVSYSVTAGGGKAYKIVTYVKTNTKAPVMISSYANGSSSQFGSSADDATIFGWTKIETYIGSSGGASDNISSFTYTLSANTYSSSITSAMVYFTVPEVYETTHFDYQHNSLWPTDQVFTFFRPGESYINTGSSKFSFPTNYRKMTRAGEYFMPSSCILQNPTFLPASNPFPNIKNVVASDLNSYKYFVSDKTSKSISAMYETYIKANKIVIKFNAIATTPTFRIYLDESPTPISVSQTGQPTVTDLTPDSNGVLVIYWNGTSWTKDKWTTMPTFTSSGAISLIQQFKHIRITQTAATAKTPFNSYTGGAAADISRMHLIEVSPRIEIDLSDYVTSTSINKSLDSKNNAVPISSIDANDSSVVLSGIPLTSGGQIVPLFSNQSNNGNTVLAGLMRKNVKIYNHYYLKEYSHPSTNVNTVANILIPGGAFYADTWSESDVDTVTIQAFDVTRFLQSIPVTDYVSNLKSVFEVITNILELSGFTDYDYDSLYDICKDQTQKIDLSYFYCNSQDSTIAETLSDLFLAYQIGAYIDEYGVMKFLSLSNIIEPKSSVLTIDELSILDGGYSTESSAKVGKVSVRYQTPRIRQSPAMQNVTDPTIGESPSFIYTTANSVVWAQESVDSVGFNYLSQPMTDKANRFSLNVNDLLDIFHTFSLNSNGYAAIENEIVSFEYKEYTISQQSPSVSTNVSVKNDLELAAAINDFTKTNQTKLKVTTPATITNAYGTGTLLVFTANNTFSTGDRVMVSGVRPSSYNVTGTIVSATPTTFSVAGETTAIFDSLASKNPTATISSGYDITITPTGNITNVKRGLFGSKVEEHKPIITNIANKNLSELSISDTYTISSSSATSVADSQINFSVPANQKILLFPTTERDTVFGVSSTETYGTYSTKIKFNPVSGLDTAAAGIFFNMPSSQANMNGTYFVELIRYKTTNTVANKVFTNYAIAVYYFNAGSVVLLAWADVTGTVNGIIANFERTFEKQGIEPDYSYTTTYEEIFKLKAVRWNEGSTKNGESAGQLLSVFLNNVEINNWQVSKYGPVTVNDLEGDSASDWQEIPRNDLTKLPQKISLPIVPTAGTIFGSYMTTKPITISGITYTTISSTKSAGAIREIYATQKPLKERSVSYYFQDREFLNSMVQKQNLFSKSKSYMMQTKPEVSGINYYDVQYTTPAATTVDVNPILYLWYYFPGTSSRDQEFYQKKDVDEYSLAYSSVLNTGFRARMAIANNSRHMIFLKHDSDQLNQFTNTLTLWTHELIAPADPEVMEKVIDQTNAKEVAQLDSVYIQSKSAAEKLLYLVSKGIDGFSIKTSLNIFGNPLIQVGDIITLSYPLAGVVLQKYVVHSVSHTFSDGLETSVTLNKV